MKKNFTNPILSILFFSLAFAGMAQESIDVTALQKDPLISQWHFWKDVNSVNLYYQYVDCDPISYVNFKLENKSGQIQTISWTFEFYNNGTLLEVNPDDVSASYELFPGEIKKGECDHGANLTLQIYVREGYDPLRMTHINLTGLRVAH